MRSMASLSTMVVKAVDLHCTAVLCLDLLSTKGSDLMEETLQRLGRVPQYWPVEIVLGGHGWPEGEAGILDAIFPSNRSQLGKQSLTIEKV